MLEGRDFKIFTNHKPLTHALFWVSPSRSTLQQGNTSYLAEFNSVVHVPWLENVVADALSSPSPVLSPSTSALVPLSTLIQLSPAPSPPSSDKPVIPGLDVSLLSLLQLTCPSFSEMCSSPTLSVVSIPLRARVLLCDSSTGSLRPLVPL